LPTETDLQLQVPSELPQHSIQAIRFGAQAPRALYHLQPLVYETTALLVIKERYQLLPTLLVQLQRQQRQQ